MYSRECNEAPGISLGRAMLAVHCCVSAMSRSAQCRGQCNVASAPADVNVVALGRSHVELTWAGDLELRVRDHLSPLGDPARQSTCLLYTSPSPRDRQKSRMPSS